MSWIIIAALITWSLAVGFFPHFYPGLSSGTYWLMGIAGALGLFLSIIIHEFGHSVIARRQGIPMKGITLFIFGGVAEMGGEPPTAKSEFFMAIAGPIASVIMAGVFWGLHLAGQAVGAPMPVLGVVGYLAFINGVLVLFNMIPAFPLDGGRVLRSALWGWKGNLRWATRIASSIGGAFGFFLMGLAIVSLFLGNFIGGIWWFLLGMFIRAASQMSYEQVLLRRSLEGEPVRRFMRDHPVTVDPSAPIKQLVEEYVYVHQHKMYPVVRDGRLLGCVSLEDIKQIPREEWDRHTVGELVKTRCKENTIEPEMDAVKALSIMREGNASRLMVVEGDRLVGIIALKDLLTFLSLKVELEEAA